LCLQAVQHQFVVERHLVLDPTTVLTLTNAIHWKKVARVPVSCVPLGPFTTQSQEFVTLLPRDSVKMVIHLFRTIYCYEVALGVMKP
jgi:hypothetical protein